MIDRYTKWKQNILIPHIIKHKERGSFTNDSNIPVEHFYYPEGTKYHIDEAPGEYPFTRGIHPTMYRGKIWTMRQYAGYGSPDETNKRYKYLLESGQTGLSVAFDLPTQMGLDSDDPLSSGEVGRCGVAIDSIDDFERLFNGISLDKISVSMTINATAIVILAMYVALAEKHKIDSGSLSGTVQNDILKEYIARGTYIFPIKQSIKLVIDVIEYSQNHLPRFNPISISGYHIREAGADAIQELAYTFANGITYLEEALTRGLNIEKFAERLSFFFNSQSDFFFEIAKFRASRRIWAKIIKERFGIKRELQKLRFHTQTSGFSLKSTLPKNNIVRVALQALSAVLGGTQSLHTNSLDEAFALPTEESAEIALRTQQIIAEESGVTNTIDPLGGSYYVEELTNRIEKEVFNYLERIERNGGMIKAIENGSVSKEIHEKAFLYQKKLEGIQKRDIAGENRIEKILKIDEGIERREIEKIKKLRKNRDNNKVEEALSELKRSAKNENVNLFHSVLTSVKNHCTLGEITGILKSVYGVKGN